MKKEMEQTVRGKPKMSYDPSVTGFCWDDAKGPSVN
jgi:hypothetical protein